MSKEKKKEMSEREIGEVADLFGILAVPSRLRILQALMGGPLSVGELVERTGLSQANVSKHLATLYAHKLVGRKPEGVFVHYRIADPVVKKLCALVCGRGK